MNMRATLIAAASIAAMAFATSASASSDYYGLQVNAVTAQVGTTNVQHIGVGDALNVSAAAVGNNLSVESTILAPEHSSSFGRRNDDARVASAQINALTVQTATTNLSNLGVAGDLNVDTQAIGNSVDVSSENGFVSNGYIAYGDKSVNLQANVGALQVATANISALSVGDELDVSTVAVGSNASFFGGAGVAALSGQLNAGTLQLATTNVNYIGATGAASLTTQAIGNASSFTGNTVDPLNLQGNVGTAQIAVTNVGFSGFGGDLSVNTSAIGNTASVANVRSN